MTSDNNKDAFRESIGEMERLLCLALDYKQSNHALCTALWSAVEAGTWSLHALEKHGIEDHYRSAVEALTDSIQ